MQIEHYDWYSERLNRNMHIARYGHWGHPIIVFPTSHGGWKQFEDYGMPSDCQKFIDNGKVQFFSIDDVNADSWYNFNVSPEQRVINHMAYEEYVLKEVIPFIWDYARNDNFGVMGCSFGAFQTVNILLRHPDIFKYGFSFSGDFDIKEFLDNHYDDSVYFNNPIDYVHGMKDTRQSQIINEKCQLWLMTGEQDFSWDGTLKLHNKLLEAGINHNYESWAAPCFHNEIWWKKQLPHILNKLF